MSESQTRAGNQMSLMRHMSHVSHVSNMSHCFHVYAQKSLFIGENGNAFFGTSSSSALVPVVVPSGS